MASLLDVLLKNESGGRNIPNTTEGTDSGQAQGYFQITTGTWDSFGGRQFAARPLDATYEQQANIASKIPLKRWAPSTVALMQATGKPLDPNRTLGENLAANGESFSGATAATSTSSAPAYTTLLPPNPADAFARFNDSELYADTEAVLDKPQSLLADTLSASVAGDDQQQDSSPGGYSNPFGSQPQTSGGEAPAPKAAPPQDMETPPATPGPTGESLADVFKVRDIGLTGLTDPATGQPLLPRHRRQYG
jgi:hypothetical protein